MSNYGPWTTAIHDHDRAQLGPFWKRRIHMLSGLTQSSGTSRLAVAGIVAIALLNAAVPTLLAFPGETQPATNEKTSTAAQSFESFAAQWKQQQTEIRTAFVRYRSFRLPGFLSAGLCREDVNEILDAADFSSHPRGLDRLIDVARLPESVPRNGFDPARFWQTKEFYLDGRKTREQTFRGDDVVNVQLFNGDYFQSWDDRAGQVTVSMLEKSHIRRDSLSDFRYLPSSMPAPDAPGSRSHGLVTFNLGQDGSRLVVEDKTALVRGLVAASESGELIWELQQQGTHTAGDNINFSRIKVDTTYHHGKLHSLTIYVIESVRFNEEVPAEMFRLSVPTGTRVVISPHRRYPTTTRQSP